MKTKLEMAHDYLRDIVSNWEYDDSFDPVAEAWKYADAMQVEADKREKEEQSEHVFEAIEEWQPDWSQAPDWANWWAVDGFDRAYWFEDSPKLNIIDDTWDNHYRDKMAGDYGYTGDWRNSLRKRPK